MRFQIALDVDFVELYQHFELLHVGNKVLDRCDASSELIDCQLDLVDSRLVPAGYFFESLN